MTPRHHDDNSDSPSPDDGVLDALEESETDTEVDMAPSAHADYVDAERMLSRGRYELLFLDPFLDPQWSFLREAATVQFPKLKPSLPRSSLGDLDKLPAEMLNMVLLRLDVRSLCRFMSVASRARDAVESLPAYRHLAQHAGSVLVTLGKTRLTKTHTVESLYGVLKSPSCVSCDKPGAFICLVTCERACLNCMNRNVRFWVMAPDEARQYYLLSDEDVKSLPTMWTEAAGCKCNRPICNHRIRPQKVVSERCAAELAVRRQRGYPGHGVQIGI